MLNTRPGAPSPRRLARRPAQLQREAPACYGGAAWPRSLMPSADHPALAAVDALRLRLDELDSAIETARLGIRGRDEVADLSRAAVALDRAQRALADIDSDVRIVRSLFAYATGEWK